jgi:hypothetical protein
MNTNVCVICEEHIAAEMKIEVQNGCFARTWKGFVTIFVRVTRSHYRKAVFHRLRISIPQTTQRISISFDVRAQHWKWLVEFHFCPYKLSDSRNSAAASDWIRAGRPGIALPVGLGSLDSGGYPAPIRWVLGATSPEGQRPEDASDHPLPPSADMTIRRAFPQPPSHT